MIITPRIITLLLLIASLTILGCDYADDNRVHETSEESEADFNPSLSLHFINVAQGDATLVMGDGFTILVDAGRHDRDDVVPYLEKIGVGSIDLLVGTHPHADHIGQFPQVLEFAAVDEVWMSGDLHTTLTFERALDAIDASGARYHEPRAGELVEFGDLSVHVIHPMEITGDLNDGSIVLRLDYHELSVLLTGDAERAAELEMTEGDAGLQSDILKLGHHGSSSSTTQVFLDMVQPDVAIYSAGRDNSYGHPHAEVTDRLDDKGVEYYGTDQSGTILVESDGTEYRISESYADPIHTDEDAQEEKSENGDLAGEEGCIELNRASLTELTEIIHIGAARAEEIREMRPIDSLDNLKEISGISPNRLEDIVDEGKACIEQTGEE